MGGCGSKLRFSRFGWLEQHICVSRVARRADQLNIAWMLTMIVTSVKIHLGVYS